MVSDDKPSSSGIHVAVVHTPDGAANNPRKKVRVFRDRMTNSAGSLGASTATLGDNIRMVNGRTAEHGAGSRSWKVRRVVLSPDMSQDASDSSSARSGSNGSPALRALKISLKVPIQHVPVRVSAQAAASSFGVVDGQSAKKRARF